jgi:hypothetical protein
VCTGDSTLMHDLVVAPVDYQLNFYSHARTALLEHAILLVDPVIAGFMYLISGSGTTYLGFLADLCRQIF